jgi:hypothetical protein
VPDRSFTDEEIDRAVQALTQPERFNQAEARVARIAPQLQRVLGEALDVGGYFGQLREGELFSAAKRDDLDERVRALRTLLAEETRLGMLVGVAVGWELAKELELKEEEK